MRKISLSMIADGLGAIRHGDAAQPLHRLQIRHLAHHAAEIVDAVGVGHEAVPALPLGHLLGAAMVEADVGPGRDDLLAVERQHDAKHAVRRHAVRAVVQDHQFDAVAMRSAGRAPPDRSSARCSSASNRAAVMFERRPLGGARRLVLAQRMAFPQRRQQDARDGARGLRNARRTCRRLRARTSRRWDRRSAIDVARGAFGIERASSAGCRRCDRARSDGWRW